MYLPVILCSLDLSDIEKEKKRGFNTFFTGAVVFKFRFQSKKADSNRLRLYNTTVNTTLNIVVVVVVVAGRGGDPEAGQVCRAEDLPAVPLLLGPEADVRGERLHAPRHIRDQVHLLTQGTGNSGHHLSSFFC